MSKRDDDDDDENFATFGEALEELEEDTLRRKKPITVEDQYALDAQGRRRFHGAFTGGFSAGYFNSVGTRDGWRPQQFKSSRNIKADNVLQRPQDFMDEEDTGEFGIAPTGIRATVDFSDRSERGKKRRREQTDPNQPIPGVPVLKELLKPVTYTMGVTLLKKMGWKPGQGVGPRLAKKEKEKIYEKNVKKKVYGCTLPGRELNTCDSNSENSDNDEEILFAPDDYEPFRCNPKDNYFGIGYSGLERQSVLSNHLNLFDTTTFTMKDKNKKLSIRGQAFGVGVFEADDEDIYSSTDMSNYDFSLGSETKKTNRRSNEKKYDTSKDNCIYGFVLAKNCLKRKKIFDPPLLPRDFNPVHRIRKSRFSSIVEVDDNKQKSCFRQELNAQDRFNILDASPNASTSSVNKTEILNLSETSKTVNFVESQKLKVKPSWMDKLNTSNFLSGGVEGSTKNFTETIQSSEKLPKICLLNQEETLEDFKSNEDGDKNYITKSFTDPEKQKRFEKFLNDFNDKEKLLNFHSKCASDEEFKEFTQVAQSFEKPEKSVPEDKQFVSKAVENNSNLDPEDQMIKAAKMNMFGKLTRTIEVWQPASVVCKQLNIPEPFGKSMKVEPQKRKKYSIFESFNILNTNEVKYQKATDTAGSFKEPVIMDKSFEKKVTSNDSEINNLSISNKSDIELEVGFNKLHEENDNFRVLSDVASGKDNLNRTNFATASVNSLKTQSSNEDENTKADNTQVKESSLVAVQLGKVEANKDLFKAIFLSSSDESETEDDLVEDVDNNTVKSLLIGKSATELNIKRNTSPPRGIFAKLDFDDLMSSKKLVQKKNENNMDSNESTIAGYKDKQIQVIDIESLSSSATTQPEVSNLPNTYGPVLPKQPTKVEDTSDSREKQKSKVITKLNNSEVSLKWVEKIKSKKSKKEKKKYKHKEKKKRKNQKKER
ncbi:G patch domain-containing protein 1 homolog [Microplitis mediator]|uniref:G patch domain-containing protein 1 homolog n=1 Tax=Microplitis mediator TaxID=375433 RepID=UPI0025539245|nr:G patch domain-containing protein 1 homolog [Microplitis mediator]